MVKLYFTGKMPEEAAEGLDLLHAAAEAALGRKFSNGTVNIIYTCSRRIHRHIPGLLTADLGQFGNVSVLNVVAGDYLVEAFRYFLIHRVGDLGLSVSPVLRQLAGLERPLVVRAGGYGQRFDGLLAVLDIDRDAAWHEFLIIALHIPGLLAADLGQFGNVSVLNVVAGDYLVEAFRYFLIHRVGDLGLSVSPVLRQLAGLERPLVVRAGGYGQRFDGLLAVLDVDRDALGHEIFVIARHIPGLLAADLGQFGNVGVLNVVAGDYLVKAFRYFLIYTLLFRLYLLQEPYD